MKNFLLELWHDLREKRLWPVALVLVIAIVAIPVALSKPSEEPPAPSPTPKASATPQPEDFKGLASVTLDESELGAGSTLDTFDPSDPFRPPANVVERSTDADDPSSAGPGPSSVAETDTPSPDTGTGDSGGGKTTDDGGDTPGGDDTDPPGETRQYAYVVDVTFTSNTRTRRIEGMERLDMLPNQANPLLLFLGVTPNAGNAVFLVDSTLQAAGEGRCKPSGDECAFLHIGAGSVHEFTNDEGDSYRLRIDEIRKVKVGNSSASASRRNSPTATAAVGSAGSGRRFAVPILADVVTVSNGDRDHSNSDRNNR
jgi:hypothetical protein